MKKVFIFTYADDNKKVLTKFTQLWDEINNKEIINVVKRWMWKTVYGRFAWDDNVPLKNAKASYVNSNC